MPSASRPAAPTPARGRLLACFAAAVFVLAVTAAVVSFVNGSWLGVVWILLAGLSSNMAWFYVRRLRMAHRRG